MTMEEALYLSSNTYFMALQDALGSIEGPVRVAERMGMHFTASSADQIIGGNRGSFTLGAEATSPLDLASAYATLPPVTLEHWPPAPGGGTAFTSVASWRGPFGPVE